MLTSDFSTKVKPKANIPADFQAAHEPLLSNLQFRYPMRGYQHEILDLVDKKLAQGEREIHIVAPPGAGKTIIGLQMISTLKCPALILCPNTTIQSQWGGKLNLFLPHENDSLDANDNKLRLDSLLGTQDDKPLKPITVLTYQVLSTPGREQEYLEKLAHNSWVKELIKGRSGGTGEAELRILEIFQNNPKAYQKEISRHVSRLRKRLAEEMDLNEVLHPNAVELLQTLRRQKFKVVLFDECHHLTDYWAAIMQHLVKYLDNPVVIGLTGTPPEKKSASQELRYLNLVGDIDYQVPTPALVREKGLSPFQDLVYFVEPTKKEFDFLSEQHIEFHQLIEELCGSQYLAVNNSPSIEAAAATFSFDQETSATLHTGQLSISGSGRESNDISDSDTTSSAPSKKKYPPLTQYIFDYSQRIESEQGFSAFFAKNIEIGTALLRAIYKLGLPKPRAVEFSEHLTEPTLEDWMIIIEDFASQKLKLSNSDKSHKLYERIRSATRKLGYAITEQGLRKQASPVDRVLAFSEAKPRAVADILKIEYRVLQDRLRAVVVTDFESMSATAVKGVLNQESGGAIAAMRILLNSDVSLYLNPCMVTGSHLLVDSRIKDQFLEAAKEFLKEAGYSFELSMTAKDGDLFSSLSSSSSAWESRLYVALSTSLFERGITKCLIGTRGLFGEGWDSQALNTLIDLTTTTSPVSVKQLRGRSIRIQNDALGARKVANNWDVVCIAPSLEKGLNDYQRFVRKHDGYFGICDDGQIECGVGHVHPAFSELTPAQVFASIETFNQEMADRALVRDQIYDLWKIGEPYKNRLFECLEVAKMRKLALTPPHIRYNSNYKEHARYIRSALDGVWVEYLGLSSLISAAVAFFLAGMGPIVWAALLPTIGASALAMAKRKALFLTMKKELCQPNSQESSLLDIAYAVLAALQQIKLVPRTVGKENIHATVRSDGSYRIFLDITDSDTSKYFNQSLKEVLAPLSNQPYLIAKYEFALADIASEEESDRFFRKYINGRAEPRIGSYHPVPNLLARSEKGRKAFQEAWNKYVSPGFVIGTETKPELLNKYFGIGPSLAQRLLWE